MSIPPTELPSPYRMRFGAGQRAIVEVNQACLEAVEVGAPLRQVAAAGKHQSGCHHGFVVVCDMRWLGAHQLHPVSDSVLADADCYAEFRKLRFGYHRAYVGGRRWYHFDGKTTRLGY